MNDATIVVCAYRGLQVETHECLGALERAGMPPTVFHHGDALIDRARSKALSHWYMEGTSEVILFIDDDIMFRPQDAVNVIELAREKRGIACGAYAVRDGSHLALRPWTRDQAFSFGPDAAPINVRYAAAGFMAVHHDVMVALAGSMTPVETKIGRGWWPVCQPFPLEDDYLSEDYAFCQRAREHGFEVWLDPRAMLQHITRSVVNVFTIAARQKEAAHA